MSATAIAISSVALAQSAQASAEAHAARVLACQKYVQGYSHDVATVGQRQEYASCVGLLNPQPATSGDLLLVKVLIVLVFAGIAVGIWMCKRDRFADGWVDYVMFSAIGGVMLPVGAGVLAALGYGAWFLVAG